MGSQRYDAIIVGCGIAGATLCWQLHLQGKRLLVINDHNHSSASKAAAGVISPITGKRHTVAWRWREFWPEAHSFYRRIESETGVALLRTLQQLRFPEHRLTDEIIARIKPYGRFTSNAREHIPHAISTSVAQHGVIEIENGLLDVKQFLQATYQMLDREHRLHSSDIPYTALEISDENITIRALGAISKRIIFCEGARGEFNPWFDFVNFESVRGENLIISNNKLPTNYVYQHGMSLVPSSEQGFYAGATYEWRNLHASPTDSGRQDLVKKISSMLSDSFVTLSHQSGIRPVIVGRKPVACQHPILAGVWFFNGLASSGCLQAPFLAKQLAAGIFSCGTKQDFLLPAQKSSSPAANSNLRLTGQVHRLISEVLLNGDIAIDATAGNGNDTKFLAEQVSPSGRVFAFDVQPLALARSKRRLEKIPHKHVEFELRDHAELPEAIPEEHHGEIAAVTFNLGYLPGTDKKITTLAASTCSAIQSATRLMKPGGICTVLCYRGHTGGENEAEQVKDLLKLLTPNQFTVNSYKSSNESSGPILYAIRKLSQT